MTMRGNEKREKCHKVHFIGLVDTQHYNVILLQLIMSVVSLFRMLSNIPKQLDRMSQGNFVVNMHMKLLPNKRGENR